ncbi:MAG TPA: hypothetical protein VNK94_01650 [Gaiellaceae bacterium]|nr:hypothetical protein [Gaiellaceae bacterium]
MDDLLRRLLGPDRPELTCEQCFAHLPAYVELHVVPDTQFERCPTCMTPAECDRESDCLGLRAHLDGCPACREEYESLHALVSDEQAAS